MAETQLERGAFQGKVLQKLEGLDERMDTHGKTISAIFVKIDEITARCGDCDGDIRTLSASTGWLWRLVVLILTTMLGGGTAVVIYLVKYSK